MNDFRCWLGTLLILICAAGLIFAAAAAGELVTAGDVSPYPDPYPDPYPLPGPLDVLPYPVYLPILNCS